MRVLVQNQHLYMVTATAPDASFDRDLERFKKAVDSFRIE